MINNTKPKKPIRILCIDGGGTRGIIPARILQEFEEKTKKPVHELFDIILGTSTGGIIGLALTRPDPKQPSKAFYTAKDGVNLYLDNCGYIFSSSFWEKLLSGFGFWSPRHDRSRLDERLKSFFGDTRLSEALCPVGVLSYSLTKNEPRLWSSFAAKREEKKNHFMRDAAAVTSAAPGLFAPKEIATGDEKEKLAEIDGAIYANNPAIAAFMALAELYPGFRRDDLVIVSVGTGKEDVAPYRLLPNFFNLINAMINASGRFVDEAIAAVTPNGYYDLEVKLPENLMYLDRGDKRYLQKLVGHAETLLKKEKHKIEELLKKLTAQ